jgi:RNA polymerase sigma factor (sigma-70 family)
MSEQGRKRDDSSVIADASDWSHLMGRAQQGDRDAYHRLLTEVTPYLRALARRNGVMSAEVEDVVQDTLLTVHTIRHTYDPRRPIGPWLVTIARRRIVDRLRRRQRRAAVEAAFERSHETFATVEANLYAPSVDTGGLRQAIERLPAGQRQAVILLKLREMSLKEAARESGMTATSLKVAAHRGLKALRKLLSRRSDP